MNMMALLAATGGGAPKLYVDDVFSAYTYTGNGSTQTITNGIDLAGKGGMVWAKSRASAASHLLWDTTRGSLKYLQADSTATEALVAEGVSAFGASGFNLTGSSLYYGNGTGQTYVAWTFANAPKFFKVATVTKSSGSNATVDLSTLGTVGMVKVKRTDSTGSWYVWHRGLSAGKLLIGETTAAEATLGHITVSGTTLALVNGVIADGTYHVEAYAHDTSADGLIQCGSFSGNGIVDVNLGWEAQFVEIRAISLAAYSYLIDTARSWSIGKEVDLRSNSSAAEIDRGAINTHPTATGFKFDASQFSASATYIFKAIRRPNRPPTSGTQVYNAISRTGTGAAATVTGVGFAPDLGLIRGRNNGMLPTQFDRLRGANRLLRSDTTIAEVTAYSDMLTSYDMDGITLGVDAGYGAVNQSTWPMINHFFKRAPGVMDQICYGGSGASKTEAHNLTVAPELWLGKGRSGATQWVWGSSLLAATEKIVMPSPAGKVTDATAWNSTYPTASAISLGTAAAVNTNATTCVLYMWATLAGVSKVFGYTGDGASGKVIPCGFTAGARFVLIVRTDAAGSVYLWDSTRGIVAGNDPHLCLDTTAAEVTTDDSIDPDASGFIVNQVAATNINVNGATYIGLAYA